MGCRDICIYLVHSYREAECRTSVSTEAPLNYFQLFKNLAKYPDYDVFRVTVNKLCGYLWYLAPEIMG